MRNSSQLIPCMNHRSLGQGAEVKECRGCGGRHIEYGHFCLPAGSPEELWWLAWPIRTPPEREASFEGRWIPWCGSGTSTHWQIREASVVLKTLKSPWWRMDLAKT